MLERDIVSVVIDRTFVDDGGVRWIVDYKTSSHEGAGLDEFLDRERERYAPQLERYARADARLGDEPITRRPVFPAVVGVARMGAGRAPSRRQRVPPTLN